MTYTTTISSKGQITLPASIRRSLNIDAGDRLKISKHGDKVTLVPDNYDEKLKLLREKTEKHLKNKGLWGLTLEDIEKGTEKAMKDYYKDKYEI